MLPTFYDKLLGFQKYFKLKIPEYKRQQIDVIGYRDVCRLNKIDRVKYG